MTKKEFMYITGFTDEEQLANIMLLGGDEEPLDGDLAELLKKWYDENQKSMIEYMDKYHECQDKYDQLHEYFRKMRTPLNQW